MRCQQFQLASVFGPSSCAEFLAQRETFSNLTVTFCPLQRGNAVFLPRDEHAFLYGTDISWVREVSVRFLLHCTRSHLQTNDKPWELSGNSSWRLTVAAVSNPHRELPSRHIRMAQVGIPDSLLDGSRKLQRAALHIL